MRKIKKLGLLGISVIGSGWAARALHAGIDVIANDINPKMEDSIRGTIETAFLSLNVLTEGMNVPPKGQLNFTKNPIEMAEKSDFIQENVPEVLEIKRNALAPIAEATEADVIISSSTSGFMPSKLQEGMTYPERFVVGHPFNPVYLCPLVEVVGGTQTTNETKEAARNFYQSIGMHTLMVRREVPGHISDRLQEAMWREILHALNDNIATTGELDESIVYGPGLRWAIMGMNQVYMMAGGEGGARHFIKQFGPTLDLPWSHLKAPELTETIINRFVDGTTDQAKGKTIREMETIRDECLVAIQRVLAKHNIGAGKTLNAFKERLHKKVNEETL